MRIAQEAMAFLGIMPADGQESAYEAQYKTIMEEIAAQDGQAIPDGQVPNLVLINLNCGLSFPLPPWSVCIDRRTKGILRS